MSRKGPPPTPTKILALRGSWRAKIRKREPKPVDGTMETPKGITKSAKPVWDYAIKHLQAMGLLSLTDREPLWRWSELCVEWHRARSLLEKEEQVIPIKDGDGNVVRYDVNQKIVILLKLGIELRKLEQEFGMSPAARASIGVALEPKKHTEDDDNLIRVV